MEVEPGGHGPPISNPQDQSVAAYLNLLSEQGRLVRNKIIDKMEVSKNELEYLREELCSVNRDLSIENLLARQNTRLIHNVRRLLNKVTTYDEASFPPFLVIMEHEEKGRSLHPMNIAKLLHEQNIQGIKEVSSKGRSKVGISFVTPSNANNFIQTNTLSSKGYKTFIPERMLYSRGIIRNIGDKITEEDFISFGYGLRGSKKIKIIDAARFNYKKKENGVESTVPGSTFMILFAGNLVPQEVVLFNTKRNVAPYINPVVMCHKCLKFGHHQSQCRNSARCLHCGDGHEEEDCDKKENHTKSCPNCGGNHDAFSKECKEFVRQKQINKAIADHNISFMEANRMFPKEGSIQTNPNLDLTHFPNTLQADSSPSTKQSRTRQSARYTYVSQAKRPKTPRTIGGYDQDAHREVLLPSQARTYSPSIFSSPVQQSAFAHQSQTSLESSKRYQDDVPDMDTFDEELAKSTFENLKRQEKDLIHEIIGSQGRSNERIDKSEMERFFQSLRKPST